MRLEKLNNKNFDIFKDLLGGSEFGGCYCAVWRSFDDTWVKRCQDPSAPNLEISKKFVLSGKHLGFLVYENESLVGWTGSGPKTEYPLLKTKLGSRLTPFDSEIWSIGCIAIQSSFRGQSKSLEIIKAVIEEAKRNHAKFVEAYPVKPWDEARSYRGSFSQYQGLGFEECGSEKDGESEVLCLRYKNFSD